MQVGARELKNRLGKYLKRIKLGETVVVTDRGVPIAELRPIEARKLSIEERLARMADTGDLTSASGRRFARVEPISVRGKPVSATIIEERG